MWCILKHVFIYINDRMDQEYSGYLSRFQFFFFYPNLHCVQTRTEISFWALFLRIDLHGPSYPISVFGCQMYPMIMVGSMRQHTCNPLFKTMIYGIQSPSQSLLLGMTQGTNLKARVTLFNQLYGCHVNQIQDIRLPQLLSPFRWWQCHSSKGSFTL